MLRHLVLIGLCLWATSLQGQTSAQTPPATAERAPAEQVPPLSVRTLFHPDDRFNYFSSPPPATQWTADSQLAIRGRDQWRVMDPGSGETRPWDLPERLREELAKISGLSATAIEAAVRAAAQQISRIDRPVMIEVGGGLAVVGGGKAPRLVTRDAASWQTPTLSPDGSAVAFVRENDLYVVRVETGESLRLTHDGSPTRLNGRLDWTYQEEIYGRGNFKGFWWSPDSRRIALLRIDTSDVLSFTVTGSETPRGSTHVVAYPKAGDPIPRAGLWVVGLDSLQLTPIHQPRGDEAETLVVRVTWRPDGDALTYQIQNRIQTWLELREADPASGSRRVLLREQGPAWIEILGEPRWLPGGDFLWLSDLPAGRRHLWKVSADGSRRTPVTSGDWDIRELVAVVPEQQEAFVTGDRQRGVRGQQLYRVHWRDAAEGQGSRRGPALPLGEVTPLTTAPGWHAVDVSPDGAWFTDTFSTLRSEPDKTLVGVDSDVRRPLQNATREPQPTDPHAATEETPTEETPTEETPTEETPTEETPTEETSPSAAASGGADEPAAATDKAATDEATDEAEADAPAPWQTLELPQPQWVEITTRDGVPLPAYLIPPSPLAEAGGGEAALGEDSDRESPGGDSERRYPVLVYTYGGPQAPAAVDRWNGRNGLYHQFLASRGIGVLVVDNRSSGGRGIADTWSIHRRLGVQELADLLDAVAWLKSQRWVDGERLAIRGWSYGGYYTAYALTHSDAFAAGIAGGSVTDWRNYDAFYTERYMDTPQNNEAGYRDASVTASAADLHGRLLLIHGELDDNVHLGNTLQLVAALQRAGKQFDLMLYPGETHGVADAKQLYHLYELMTQFLERELLRTGLSSTSASGIPSAAVSRFAGFSPSSFKDE
ncbi:S9 family peptidase [Candidatus Laterigemmans baculatus]|uniref:S9 family peptidase n=1 Tax=Candidatus Laterigemmans baculatus TaxID=2770505 RepID=UPI0013DD03F9|nr:S9 family peptidase [Candidatus Laterigemmans baculatus]